MTDENDKNLYLHLLPDIKNYLINKKQICNTELIYDDINNKKNKNNTQIINDDDVPCEIKKIISAKWFTKYQKVFVNVEWKINNNEDIDNKLWFDPIINNMCNQVLKYFIKLDKKIKSKYISKIKK